ncbi:MAG TPA: ATP-binding protein [Ktedonobacterales bacterium]|nr:ATP-binding protein [Ktedonobacterales bacterium]
MSNNRTVPPPLQVFRGWAEKASYREQPLSIYQGNPLIEALPPILSREQAARNLAHDPGYQEQDRWLPAELRLHLIQNVVEFFEPLAIHLDLEARISRMIRSGYRPRNPIIRGFWRDLDGRVQSLRDALAEPGTPEQEVPRQLVDENGEPVRIRTRTTATSLAMLGISGVGKSTALESILSLYPQVIYHSYYRGQNFTWTQVPWLKLECPYDGSTRGLCFEFFQVLDMILGTNYYQTYARRGRASVDEMFPSMARVGWDHSIGVLVIDEIQRLSEANSGGARKMLNFFVELVNRIGVPVILVGTYKARPLFTREFSQARRGSGQGDLVWDRMQEDEEWKLFVDFLWRYQYVQKTSSLTPELCHALYDVSQGITDFAVKAYLLAQIRAITDENQTEEVTEDMIRSVAADSFQLSNRVLKALRNGDMVTLSEYEDVYPIDLEPYIQGALDGMGYPSRSQPGDQGVENSAGQKEGTTAMDASSQQQPDKGMVLSARQRAAQARGTSHNKGPRVLPKESLPHIVADGVKRQIAAYETLQQAGFLRPAAEYLAEEAAV